MAAVVKRRLRSGSTLAEIHDSQILKDFRGCRQFFGSKGYHMLAIDLQGQRALVAGVADDKGYGFAIAKALAEAGAQVSVGTWPPTWNIFKMLLARGKLDASRRLTNGELLAFDHIYPLDAAFDTMEEVPEDIRTNKRYKAVGDFTLEGLAHQLERDGGAKPLDIVVHSLANGPEVQIPCWIPAVKATSRR